MSHGSFDREGARGDTSRLKYLHCTSGTSRVSLVPPGGLGVSGVWGCEPDPEPYEAMCMGSSGQVQLGLGGREWDSMGFRVY